MVEKVPRLRRLPVFAFFFREYKRYSPDFNLRIICSPLRSTFKMIHGRQRVAFFERIVITRPQRRPGNVMSYEESYLLFPIRAHPRSSAVSFCFSDHRVRRDHPVRSVSSVSISGDFCFSDHSAFRRFVILSVHFRAHHGKVAL
jgi:hypothetical protein